MVGIAALSQGIRGWPVFVTQGQAVETPRRGWLHEEERDLCWVSLGNPEAEPEAFPRSDVALGPRYFVHVVVPIAEKVTVSGILTDSSGNTLYKDFVPFTKTEVTKIMGIFEDALQAQCRAYPPRVIRQRMRWVRIIGPIGVCVTHKWTQEQLNAVFQHQGFQG